MEMHAEMHNSIQFFICRIQIENALNRLNILSRYRLLLSAIGCLLIIVYLAKRVLLPKTQLSWHKSTFEIINLFFYFNLKKIFQSKIIMKFHFQHLMHMKCNE